MRLTKKAKKEKKKSKTRTKVNTMALTKRKKSMLKSSRLMFRGISLMILNKSRYTLKNIEATCTRLSKLILAATLSV